MHPAFPFRPCPLAAGEFDQIDPHGHAKRVRFGGETATGAPRVTHRWLLRKGGWLADDLHLADRKEPIRFRKTVKKIAQRLLCTVELNSNGNV